MCDIETLDMGYKVDAEEISNLRDVFKVRTQCLTYNGKFVKLIVPDGFDVNAFAPGQVYHEKEDLPPGTYTYFFYTPGHVVCIPVQNKFEIGTNHYTLAYVSKAERVYAAGELEVKDKTLTFNLLSGSYMKPFMERRLKQKCGKEIHDKTTRMLQAAFPMFTVTPTTQELIRDDTVPITKAELNRYVSLGIEVRLYSDREICKARPEVIEFQRDSFEAINQKYPPKDLQGIAAMEKQRAEFQAELDRLKQYEVYRPTAGGKTRRRARRSRRRLH